MVRIDISLHSKYQREFILGDAFIVFFKVAAIHSLKRVLSWLDRVTSILAELKAPLTLVWFTTVALVSV